MFFFVDESGHTGANLFDENQPILHYGVLSAKTNLDLLAAQEIILARKHCGVERLHAAELGLGGLVEISKHLVKIQKKYRPSFDICSVAKADHAVICFFDQVFDQGMNPAMSWTGYWTPLRYILLAKLASLFDVDLAKRAWKARIDTNDSTAEAELVSICKELIPRVDELPDARSRQLIGDSLYWATQNPNELYYNCKSRKEKLTVTPNIIGFQTVMHGIASRLESPKAFARITVDQQSQFNKAQRNLAEFYASARDMPWVSGPGLPQMDLSKIPTTPIMFKSSKNSVGLELVDCYLWLFKRLLEGKGLAEELNPIINAQMKLGRFDEISINAITERWSKWFEALPDPTDEKLQIAKEMIAKDEERRKQAT